MKKRQIILLAGIGLLVASLAFAWWLSSPRAAGSDDADQDAADAAEAVSVVEVRNGPIQTYVQFTGRLQAEERIDIYAEVPGVFLGRGKTFRAGTPYQKGEILINIDPDEARQNLISQKSNFSSTLAQVVPDLKIDFPGIYEAWRQYLVNFDFDSPLKPLPGVETEQQKLFLTGRNVYAQFYTVKQQETLLGKYTIRAPFTGTLTEALITEGSLVQTGQRLGEFARTGAYELEAAVSADEVRFLAVGDSVSLYPTGRQHEYCGIITRINAKLDPQTQSIRTFIRVAGEDLRANMYLEGRARAQRFDSAFEIPRNALLPDGSVLVVQDSTAKRQPVEILKYTFDKAILAGLPDGLQVIDEPRDPSFAGSRVSIANADE